jgi:tetratricopeptide (TPR) repeat protein
MKTPSRIRQQKPSISAPPAVPPEFLSPLALSIAAVVLAAVVFAVYSPALDFQFILDDHHFVNDPRVQSPGHVWDYFTNYVWAQVAGGPSSFYRPIFILWLRVNFILSEMSPWGWHLLSILKHLSVAILLGLLVWRLLRDRVAALIAGTLFALHPAQTESVAWITVPDPLMSAAVLGSVLLYLRYAEDISSAAHGRKNDGKSRKVIRSRSSGAWLIASTVACLIALLTKETAIVLPVLLFVLALTKDGGLGAAPNSTSGELRARGLRAFRQTLPFLGVTAVYLLLRFNALGRLGSQTQHLAWSTVMLSWPATLWFYIKALLWPVRLRAFADSSPTSAFSFSGVLLPGLEVGCAVALLSWGLWWAWKNARPDLPDREAAGVEQALVLGTLILVLPLLLALNLNALNPDDFLHGRYTYLPLTGLMLLLATAWHLAQKHRTLLLIAAGVVAVAYAVLTVKQESTWRDDLTVFTVAHEVAPHNAPVALSLARAHVQVALDLDQAGRCHEAVPLFEQVTREYPQDWFAWAGLGDCFLQLNDLSNAEQSLHRAADLSHEPRVTQQWQQVRARMGGQISTPQQ